MSGEFAVVVIVRDAVGGGAVQAGLKTVRMTNRNITCPSSSAPQMMRSDMSRPAGDDCMVIGPDIVMVVAPRRQFPRQMLPTDAAAGTIADNMRPPLFGLLLILLSTPTTTTTTMTQDAAAPSTEPSTQPSFLALDAKLVKLAGDLKFIEGPVWMPAVYHYSAGFLIFSD